MEANGSLWTLVGYLEHEGRDNAMNRKGNYGHNWTLMEANGSLWKLMDPSGLPGA